jgi:hypothetical protein
MKSYPKSIQVEFHSLLLVNLYTEFEWIPWKFSKNILKTTSIKRKWFDWVAAELGIHTFDEWYLLNTSQLRNHGMKFVVRKKGELLPALKEAYPQFDVSPEPALLKPFFDEFAESVGIQQQV